MARHNGRAIRNTRKPARRSCPKYLGRPFRVPTGTAAAVPLADGEALVGSWLITQGSPVRPKEVVPVPGPRGAATRGARAVRWAHRSRGCRVQYWRVREDGECPNYQSRDGGA